MADMSTSLLHYENAVNQAALLGASAGGDAKRNLQKMKRQHRAVASEVRSPPRAANAARLLSELKTDP